MPIRQGRLRMRKMGDAMANFCNQCGAALTAGAQFCGSCGTSVGAPAAAAAPPAPAPQQAASPQPHYAPPPPPAPTSGANNIGWIIAGIATALLVIVLAWFALNRDSGTDAANGTDGTAAIAGSDVPGAADNGLVGPEVVKYVTSTANIRNIATARGPNTRVAGSLRRGTQVRGTMANGLSGDTYWLKLSDGRGYVSAINLSDGPPAAVEEVASGTRVAISGADMCSVLIKSGNLRIRSRPGGPIVGGMPYGARFQVLSWGSPNDEWIQIQPLETRHPIGWVSANHIEC